jgi:acyl transferase domain-containing protein
MHEIRVTYEELLTTHVQSRSPALPFYSTVTSQVISEPGRLNASYWRSNLENPVLFNKALQRLLKGQSQDQVLLEIGPHGALAGPIRQILSSIGQKNCHYISALTRSKDSHESILNLVGQLYIYGIPIRFPEIISRGNTLTDLPLYQ